MHSSTASLIIVIKMLRAFEKRRKNPKYGKKADYFFYAPQPTKTFSHKILLLHKSTFQKQPSMCTNRVCRMGAT